MATRRTRPRPNPSGQPALPGGFQPFWEWLGILLEFIWQEAYRQGHGAPDSETYLTATASIRIASLSRATTPPNGSDPEQFEVSATKLVAWRDRSIKSIERIKLIDIWMVCETLGLDLLNLRELASRSREVAALQREVDARRGNGFVSSRVQSVCYADFLKMAQLNIEEWALSAYPDTSVSPNYLQWARETQIVKSPLIRAFWKGVNTVSGISVLDWYAMLQALSETPDVSGVRDLPYDVFGM